MKQFDYSPLSQPVSFADAKPYIKLPVPLTRSTGIVVGLFIVTVVVWLLLLSAPISAYFMVFALMGATATAFFVIAKSGATEQVKITRFAVRNALVPTFDVKDPGLSGLYFEQGYDKELIASLDIVDEGVTLGSYQYTTGGGKSRQVHEIGFARHTLSRRLPHMVLDNKHNNFWKMTNLPEYFDSSQKLSLEGDFDSHFTLYAPKEYERDALYIFTPDVMANFIDNGFNFDAEIIDNHLYIYSDSIFFANEKFISTAYAAISSLGNKIEKQSDYYMDERVFSRAENIVAPEGRRLKSRFGLFALAGVFFVIGMQIFSFVVRSVEMGEISMNSVGSFMFGLAILAGFGYTKLAKRKK